jgi:hypothetical protein
MNVAAIALASWNPLVNMNASARSTVMEAIINIIGYSTPVRVTSPCTTGVLFHYSPPTKKALIDQRYR